MTNTTTTVRFSRLSPMLGGDMNCLWASAWWAKQHRLTSVEPIFPFLCELANSASKTPAESYDTHPDMIAVRAKWAVNQTAGANDLYSLNISDGIDTIEEEAARCLWVGIQPALWIKTVGWWLTVEGQRIDDDYPSEFKAEYERQKAAR